MPRPRLERATRNERPAVPFPPAAQIMLTARPAPRTGAHDARWLAAAREAMAQDGRLDAAAAEWGFSSEEEALRAVGDALGMDFLDLSSAKTDPSVLRSFPAKLVHRYGVFPVGRTTARWWWPRATRSTCRRSTPSSAATGQRRGPGGRPARRGGQADQDAPRRRRGDDRRPAGAAGGEGRRDARGDRVGPVRGLGGGPGSLGRPAGQRDPRRGDRSPRERHPHRGPGQRA